MAFTHLFERQEISKKELRKYGLYSLKLKYTKGSLAELEKEVTSLFEEKKGKATLKAGIL